MNPQPVLLTTVGACDASPRADTSCAQDPTGWDYLGDFPMHITGMCDYRDPRAPLDDSFTQWKGQELERQWNLIGYYSPSAVGYSVCPYYDAAHRPRAHRADVESELWCEIMSKRDDK